MKTDPARLAERLAGQAAQARRPRTPHGAETCREFGLKIARDGTWFYHGSPIARKSLVRLFASVLRRDAMGDFWLITPVERGRIEVEDAPFTAVELRVETRAGGRTLVFRTNVDDEVAADADHPIRVETDPATQEPRPYVLVRDGLEARILRPVFYELVDLGARREAGARAVFGVESAGTFFALGPADESPAVESW